MSMTQNAAVSNMRKIMVVDDEADVELLFRQRFRREIRAGQAQLYFALSGEAALDYLQGGSAAEIVLLLSDINMPGMNGLELLKIIKEKHRYLKVFMITAYSDEYNYRIAMAQGADDYLTKPLDFVTLKQKMGLVAEV